MTFTQLVIQSGYLTQKMRDHLDIPADENLMKAMLEYVRLAELGLVVSEFVSNDKQVDFVRHEFDGMVARMEAHIASLSVQFTNEVDRAMASQFDQSNAQSYIARWHDAMRSNLENFIREIKAMSEKANETQKLVVENAAKVSTDKVTIVEGLFRNADANFDPNNAAGYFGRFRQLLADLDTGLRQQLDHNFKTGFAGQLGNELAAYFGSQSPVLVSMDIMLNKYLQTIQADIISLREAIANKEGQLEMLQKASIKGAVFEDVVAEVLTPIANVNGEAFSFTGNEKVGAVKKGDFVYTMGEKNVVVIEAKDTAVNVKAMLRYMQEAISYRNATFGILCTRDLDQLEKQTGGFNVYSNVLFCSIDMLPLAMRWVRLYLDKIQGEAAEGVDANSIKSAMAAIVAAMKNVATVKAKLTNIRQNISADTEAIATLVDELKAQIAKELSNIEGELAKAKS
jgi:hypothetical protein